MRTLLQRFVRDENGATAIEYGLIAAGIAVAIITTPAMIVAMAALLAIFGRRAGEESASTHATAGSAGRM